MTVTVAGIFTTALVSTSSQKISVSAGASWTTWGTRSSGQFKNNNKNEFMFVSSYSRSNDRWFQGMTGPPGVAGPQGPPGHNVCSQLRLPSLHFLQSLILDIFSLFFPLLFISQDVTHWLLPCRVYLEGQERRGRLESL